MSGVAARGTMLVTLATMLTALLLFLALNGSELLSLRLPSEGFDIERMVLLYARLPRLTVALTSGAALGMASAILQQVLRNPLASPTTLGISAGAKLALAVATLYLPALLGLGRDLVALCGAGAATLVVFALVGRRGFSPFSLVLAGLIVGLYCGALASILVLMNDRYLVSLFIWGGGSLAQQDWTTALSLLPRLVVLMALAALLARALTLLDLGEASAAALGLSTRLLRIVAVTLAVALAALIVSAVGVIGFIGLVSPAIARLSGARRVPQQLFWSPFIGAGLLWMADEAVQIFAGAGSTFVPTGAVTALFGAPLLLILLPRLKPRGGGVATPFPQAARVVRKPMRNLAVISFALVVIFAAAVLVGRTPGGAWSLLRPEEWAGVMDFRLPRVVAAAFAGAMLAAAGTILQRLTGNEMASPEVLGVSAGATLGVAASLFLVAAPAHGMQIGFAAAGASGVLAMIYVSGRRAGLTPERMLLAGVALGALLDAVIGALSASGDPRALQLLRWMSGSTYGAGWTTAAVTGLLGLPLVGAAVALRRWLDIVPVGAATSLALGIAVPRVRLTLFALAAALTAVGTLVVGPLSFVGLMAPHIARELGFRKARAQVTAAALGGATIMVLADWAGRTIVFPYEIPAGLVSAVIGAPFFLLLLYRSTR